MKLRLILAACLAVVWAGGAYAAGDYPVDKFEAVTQCMSDPSCSVEIEDRVSGSVKEDASLTYQYPLCISGCVMVCTTDDCWCEADDKCN
jgi:hypothetical protein